MIEIGGNNVGSQPRKNPYMPSFLFFDFFNGKTVNFVDKGSLGRYIGILQQTISNAYSGKSQWRPAFKDQILKQF